MPIRIDHTCKPFALGTSDNRDCKVKFRLLDFLNSIHERQVVFHVKQPEPPRLGLSRAPINVPFSFVSAPGRPIHFPREIYIYFAVWRSEAGSRTGIAHTDGYAQTERGILVQRLGQV